jgi:hypothetical protein
MKEFETISTHKILMYAVVRVEELIQKEKQFLEANPNSQIAKNKLEELAVQSQELTAAIIGLEMSK